MLGELWTSSGEKGSSEIVLKSESDQQQLVLGLVGDEERHTRQKTTEGGERKRNGGSELSTPILSDKR